MSLEDDRAETFPPEIIINVSWKCSIWRSHVNFILTMYAHGDRGMTNFCDLVAQKLFIGIVCLVTIHVVVTIFCCDKHYVSPASFCFAELV